MTDVLKMDRDTVHKTGTWNSVQRQHETEVHPHRALSAAVFPPPRFLSRPVPEVPEIYDVRTPFDKLSSVPVISLSSLHRRILNKSNEKCTTKKGGVASAPPSPLVPSIYSQNLGGKSKKTAERDPVFQVPCIHPRRASTQGDETKDKKLPERVQAAAGVGGTASVVWWCTCRRKEGGGVAVRFEVGGGGVPEEVPGWDNNLVDRAQAVNGERHTPDKTNGYFSNTAQVWDIFQL